MKGKTIIMIIALLSVFMLCGCLEETEEEKAANAEHDKNITIMTLAQEAVKANLKAPSTAKFPWSVEEYQIKETSSDNEGMVLYWVSGHVDAENGFGAQIRSNFVVRLECTEDLEKYKILDVRIE